MSKHSVIDILNEHPLDSERTEILMWFPPERVTEIRSQIRGQSGYSTELVTLDY